MSFLKGGAGKKLGDVIPGLALFTFDPDIGSVLVTSGSGVIGSRVAASLLEAGHQGVKVGIWKGDRVVGGDKSLGEKTEEALKAKGAECVPFNWADESTYAEALSGVKTVFCTIPRMEGWAEAFPAFIRACKRAQVEHFVKISFFHAGVRGDPYREVPFVKFHGTCDDLVENSVFDSRLSYTILCTSHLMSTPLVQQGPRLRDEHKYITASYGMGVNYVSPNDVADAALVCLLDLKKHRNKTYTITGPGPIFDKHVAELFSKFFGTNIEHIEMGYHDFKAFMKKTDLPSWLVRDSAAMERIKASGADEKPDAYTNDFEMITHKKPETFKHYLDHKESMSLQENPNP
jgi:uncharacterized protein YbjT (DUF2867 family)